MKDCLCVGDFGENLRKSRSEAEFISVNAQIRLATSSIGKALISKDGAQACMGLSKAVDRQHPLRLTAL